jgi:hypothetical protein
MNDIDLEEAAARYEAGDAWDEADEVVKVEVKRPLDKVIPVRLSGEHWAELRREAQELGLGPSTLVRVWVLERLREVRRAQAREGVHGPGHEFTGRGHEFTAGYSISDSIELR